MRGEVTAEAGCNIGPWGDLFAFLIWRRCCEKLSQTLSTANSAVRTMIFRHSTGKKGSLFSEGGTKATTQSCASFGKGGGQGVASILTSKYSLKPVVSSLRCEVSLPNLERRRQSSRQAGPFESCPELKAPYELVAVTAIRDQI